MNEKLYKLFNVNSNPFVFQIIPELFVGYEKDVKELLNALKNGNKFSMLIGPTGSGKTTLLKLLTKSASQQYEHIIYLPKPPKDPIDWITVFGDFTKPGFLASVFGRGNGISIYNLSERVNRKLNGKKCLMLIDECHESSFESLEWLRTLTDHIDNLSIVMAALPVFENMLKNNLESFMRRISTKIELTNLTKSETRELIKKRIEYMGGTDIRPFTSSTVEFIYETSAGFPREILRICNDLFQKALDKNISTIDYDFVKENECEEKRVSLDTVNVLPSRQKMILDVLAEKGEMSPPEIVSSINIDEYKNKDNALRSVNNLLRRLMSDGFIERKKTGKTYRYYIARKFQTMLVND